MGKIREPISDNARKTKEKIIDCGFELMCECGYHHVNCIQIAKKAEVSTGIVYQYFIDKKNIFIEGTKKFADKIMFPMAEILCCNIECGNDFERIILALIDETIEVQSKYEKHYHEMMSMCALDSTIADIIHEKEMDATMRFAEGLSMLVVKRDDLIEKSHLILHIINDFSEEVNYHRHYSLDYNKLKGMVLSSIKAIIDN